MYVSRVSDDKWGVVEESGREGGEGDVLCEDVAIDGKTGVDGGVNMWAGVEIGIEVVGGSRGDDHRDPRRGLR